MGRGQHIHIGISGSSAASLSPVSSAVLSTPSAKLGAGSCAVGAGHCAAGIGISPQAGSAACGSGAERGSGQGWPYWRRYGKCYTHGQYHILTINEVPHLQT